MERPVITSSVERFGDKPDPSPHFNKTTCTRSSGHVTLTDTYAEDKHYFPRNCPAFQASAQCHGCPWKFLLANWIASHALTAPLTPKILDFKSWANSLTKEPALGVARRTLAKEYSFSRAANCNSIAAFRESYTTQGQKQKISPEFFLKSNGFNALHCILKQIWLDPRVSRKT